MNNIKALMYGENKQLPFILRGLNRLRHGQITFTGLWQGTVGQQSTDT